LAEDARLDIRYRRARDVLWAAPCDLDVAAPLVADYTEAVNALVAGRDVPAVDVQVADVQAVDEMQVADGTSAPTGREAR
jgi:hypothetical protein